MQLNYKLKRKRLNKSNVKNMVHFYIGLLSEQWYIIAVIVLMYLTISVQSQPLHLPAEGFKCGPESLNLTCERWGYEACINDGSESYCFPCNDEYLTTLCGTQEETPGCNIYCTQEAVDREIKRTKANLTEQLQYISQQAYIANTENKSLVKRKKTLERINQNKGIAVIAVAVALGVAIMVLIIVCVYFNRMKINNKKENKYDEEIPNKDDSASSTSLIKEAETETNKSDETEPKESYIKPDSIEDLNESLDSQGNTMSTEDVSTDVKLYQETTEYKADEKLKSIPATNTKGNNRIAINENDANHPRATSS